MAIKFAEEEETANLHEAFCTAFKIENLAIAGNIVANELINEIDSLSEDQKSEMIISMIILFDIIKETAVQIQ